MRVRVPGVQLLLLLLVIMLLVLVIAVPPDSPRVVTRENGVPVSAASLGADLAPISEHGRQARR
jgi:hypothetical protein